MRMMSQNQSERVVSFLPYENDCLWVKAPKLQRSFRLTLEVRIIYVLIG